MMQQLFDENFPLINTQSELEIVQSRYASLDSYYVATGCIKERKEKFEEKWNTFMPFADSNWYNKSKQTFHRFSWEVFMGWPLRTHGFGFQEHSDEGPDIILDNNTYVECTAVDRGNGADRVQPLTPGHVTNIPVDNIILRITSALSQKKEQYKGWMDKKWFSMENPYILALNTGDFEQIHGIHGIPFAVSAAFGVGDLGINIKTKESFWTSKKSVKKVNGADVDSAFFCNDNNSFISGIICTSRHVIDEEISSDIFYVANPLARNPFNTNLLSFMDCWIIDEKDELKRIEKNIL